MKSLDFWHVGSILFILFLCPPLLSCLTKCANISVATFLTLGLYIRFEIRKHLTCSYSKFPRGIIGVEMRGTSKDTKNNRHEFIYLFIFLQRVSKDNCQGLSDSAKLSGKKHRNIEGKEAGLVGRHWVSVTYDCAIQLLSHV